MKRKAGAALVALLLLHAPAHAQTIEPPPRMTRADSAAHFKIQLPQAIVNQSGALTVTWTDDDGRVVQQLHRRLRLDHATWVGFTLDLRRMVTTGNTVHAQLDVGGAITDGSLDFDAEADPAWEDYAVIAWQTGDAMRLRGLRDLGATAGMVTGSRTDGAITADTAKANRLRRAGLGLYIENIATDIYAAYHRYTPEHPIEYAMEQARAKFAANPDDPSALVREPSLSDPAVLQRAAQRMKDTVVAYDTGAYDPLYYSLGDESGIAAVAAFWDFDLSPSSRAAYARWLAKTYGSLTALNAEWGTQITSWADAAPMTTSDAIRAGPANLAPWNDFKAFMDQSFADALRAGAAGAHAADPRARVAIEGAQIPGWGGYDYRTLAGAVDLMEVYDEAGSLEIARDMSPDTILLGTAFDSPQEPYLIWRALLRGTRGLVLWDDTNAAVREDGTLGPRGQMLAPELARLRGGIASMIMNAERIPSGVAVVTSASSRRARWYLDQAPNGPLAWASRSAEDENGDNAGRRAQRQFIAALSAHGAAPTFIDAHDLNRATLAQAGIQLLVLPDTLALSDASVAAVRDFVAGGGVAIADHAPGAFDDHLRLRPRPALDELFAAGGHARLVDPSDADAVWSAARMAELQPPVVIDAPVETHVFRNGDALIVSLQADGQGPRPVAFDLPGIAVARDAYAGDSLTPGNLRQVTLHDGRPAIMVAYAHAPAPPVVNAPTSAHAGDIVPVAFHASGAWPIVHVTVTGPDGAARADLARTLIGRDGRASMMVPFAINDAAGDWVLTATDVLSGAAVSATIRLAAPSPPS